MPMARVGTSPARSERVLPVQLGEHRARTRRKLGMALCGLTRGRVRLGCRLRGNGAATGSSGALAGCRRSRSAPRADDGQAARAGGVEYPAVEMLGCCDGGSVLDVVALLRTGHLLTLRTHILLVCLDCSVDA